MRSRFLHAVLIVLGSASPAFPCSIVGPIPSPQQLVEAAEIIVHAKATRHSPANVDASAAFPRALGSVSFQPLRVLKGALPATDLRVTAGLSKLDDFNDRPVPYTFTRPSGRTGACFAFSYRLGGEYLLFLRRDADGRLTPYWTALAPIDEQVHGASDPWLVWVEREIERRMTTHSEKIEQGVCMKTARTATGFTPREAGGNFPPSRKVRDVRPRFPAFANGQVGSGLWIGEMLVLRDGSVAKVWTIREPRVTPPMPALSTAIVDAVYQWRYEATEDPSTNALCMDVSVNIDWK